MPTIGGCISVGEYIEIGYMLPTIRGVCTSCWVSVGPGWGMFVIWIYVSVSYISCQQSGGSVEVAGCLLDTYICIVYIMAAIGGCISVGDYIEIGYMLPTIRAEQQKVLQRSSAAAILVSRARML